MKVPLLYEDNHLLVVVKPTDVPTQADASGDPDLLEILKADLKVRHGKPGNVFLGIVHRLDRPVGGVMVFAKTSKAAARLSTQIRERTFGKWYLAVVEGVPEPSGELEDRLLKDRDRNVVRVVAPGSREGKVARLRYEVLASRRGLSLVRIELMTGRSHQVRVQFASAGYPLVGDRKYGRPLGAAGPLDRSARGSGARGGRASGGPRGRVRTRGARSGGGARPPSARRAADSSERSSPALWSQAIELDHPTLGDRRRFEANPPPARYPWNRFADRWSADQSMSSSF